MSLRLANHASMLLLDLAKRSKLDRGLRGHILPLVHPMVLYNLHARRRPLALPGYGLLPAAVAKPLKLVCAEARGRGGLAGDSLA